MIPNSLVLVGFISGLLGSIFGIGGGIIIVSILISIYAIEPRFAVGSSIFVIVISSATGVIYNLAKKRIDLPIAYKILICTIPGSLVGSFIIGFIPAKTFNYIVSLLLLSFSIFVYKRFNTEPQKLNIKFGLLSVILFFVGIMSSTTGIGGGIIYTPLLLNVLSLPLITSISTSQFILAVTTTTALSTHIFNENIQPQITLPIAIGAIFGSFLGVKILHKIPKQFINWGLIIILIGFAGYLLFSAN